MTLYHVDGELVPADEAAVGVRDRGFMYGDAAFETMRAYGGDLFEFEAHRERLAGTCQTLGMPGAVPPDLRERIARTLARNDLEDAYVRASVTRGEQPGKLTPGRAVDPTVVVLVDGLPRAGVGGERVWDSPATVETVQTRQIPEAAMPSDVKTHNYLDGILARLELRESDRHVDEALVRDLAGHVAEGATSNLFFVTGDTVHTPSLDGPVLPGITRAVVLEIADRAGIDVETGQYTVEDVREADELFLTNTTWEVRPVGELDGSGFECGPVTERLIDGFDRRVEDHYG